MPRASGALRLVREQTPETHYVDPIVVRQKTEEWTAGQIDCRLTGNHDWSRKARTVIVRMRGRNAAQVRQECARHCGVARRADIHISTYRLLSDWQLDYSSRRAKNYLLTDETGKSLGRVGRDARDAVRAVAWQNIPIIEQKDDA